MKTGKVVISAVVGLALAAVAWWWFDLPGSPRSLSSVYRPTGPFNVLVLAIDTLRGDHVGVYGQGTPRTPNIDALAAEGTYFARCQTTAPWTGPAFASLYTGLLPYHHGFYNREYYSLGPDQTTMAEIFSGAGYQTAAFVTNAYLTHAYGMAQGFQAGEKFTDQGRGKEAWLVTRSADGYTKVHGADPFFLFLHYYDVHAPYTPPAPYDRIYYSGDPRGPGRLLMETLLDPEANLLADRPDIYTWLDGVTDPAYPAAQYAAGASYVDEHVGRVVADLKTKGLYDDMLIILMSDHGEHMEEHGVYYGHALPYEEVLHVPLIIKWPGKWNAGTVVRERVSIMDVLPTILETVGLAVPEGLDGRSLRDPACGEGEGGSLLVAEQGESDEQFCKTLVEGDWKLMLFFRDGRYLPELYHLKDDPRERQNVAVEHPDIVDGMTGRIWTIFDPAEPLSQARSSSEVPLSEEERRRLKSLGYVH